MKRVYKCIGRKANKPFYLDKIRCNIFSAEELVYCVYQNAELLEKGMFTMELANWLEQECGAKELSDKLYSLVTKGGNLTQYVQALLEEMDLVESGKKKEFLLMLDDSSDANPVEKRKRRADYFLHKGRLFFALKEYEVLLEETDPEDVFLRADIYHNMGIAKANLFLLKEAEENFYRAYELDGKEEHFYFYAAAMRMRMTPAEYIAHVSEVGHMKEVMLRLEEDVRAAEERWSEGGGKEFTEKKAQSQTEGTSQYEAWLGKVLMNKKEEYKKTVK